MTVFDFYLFTRHTVVTHFSCIYNFIRYEAPIINGTGSFGALAPEAISETLNFSYTIAEGVADGTRLTFHTTATCGSDVWEGKTYITAGKAVLEYNSYNWKGEFVPGESFDIAVTFDNKGHYMATNAVATLTSSNQYLTINEGSYEVGTIDPNGSGVAIFNVTVDASCPEDEQITIDFSITADGGLTASGTGVLKNSCIVIFELADSYGDGWNGASLTASFSDGTPDQNMTISSGNSASYELEIGHNVHVTLTWHAGSWDSECSYVVKYGDGTIILQNGATGGQFDVNCGLEVDPVTDLVGTLNDGIVDLSWTASLDAAEYSILRNGISLGRQVSRPQDRLRQQDGPGRC